MKKLLILGGTRQIGRRLVERLLDSASNAYEITLFNRGQTAPDLFPTVRNIRGDRYTDDVKQLFKEDWDVVLDTSGLQAPPLKQLVVGLKHRVRCYIFISTVSVYDYDRNRGVESIIAEDFPRKSYTEEQLAVAGLKYYGQHKVASEDIIMATFPQHIILRPHFIYGQYDYQRLDYYWMHRTQQYSWAILPAAGKDKLTWTYGEDLARVIEQALMEKIPSGTYNVTTHSPLTHREYLDLLQQIMGQFIELRPVPTNFLLQQQIRPIIDVPMWSGGSHLVFSNAKVKSVMAGEFTPFDVSVRASYNWYAGFTDWEKGRLGWGRAREEALWQEWETSLSK